MLKDNSVPDTMKYVEMNIAFRALVGMKWRHPVQGDLHTITFEAGPSRIEYEVRRRLSGWSSKLEIKANKVLIYEAHIVPHRGQTDTDLINTWNAMWEKMQDIKGMTVDSTRTLAFEDIHDWVGDH